jgi:Ca-activated chloride channel family protein
MLVGALALGVPALPAAAQGWIDGRITKVRSAVNVSVAGRVARVTVEEWFRNGGPAVGEGTYLYPLPGEAVFSNYSLWQGDEELRGEMMDAGQARGIYESIVRRRKDPALIELVGHGLIRARVFPINPGETRKITLRYTQVLERTGDAWRFRYAVGPDGAPRSFRLQAEGAGGLGEPYSPTHRLTTRRHGERLELGLADTAWAGGGNLELLLPLRQPLVGLSMLSHRQPGEDGFFMLLLSPGRPERVNAVSRDLVAVVDVSGSMAGDKLEQAKAALLQLLATLGDGDRFRLVAFSSGVRRFAEGWTVATPDARRDASAWVRALEATGGTNIAGALAEAFAAAPDAEHLGLVVFLTDGLPSQGERDPERLAERAERERGRFRVFAFGIGHDVNTFLLDRLTVRARGASEYVPPGGDIEHAVGVLAAKTASPVLTDLLVSGEGAELYDLQPGELPDLFGGDELVVFGRYRTADGRGREPAVTVRGRRSGRDERFATVFAAAGTPGTDYVAQLWAARKAAALARELRLRGHNAEVLHELRELALRYGILTEYTAYLVQEPGVVAVRDREMDLRRDLAPAAQSGAGAVRRAEQESKAAAVTVTADAASFNEAIAARSGTAPSQRVGGRLFVLRDSTWTDLRHGDSLRTVTVEPYGDAYFALLRALPELVKVAHLAPGVLVAGSRISVKIGAGGKRVWDAGELEDLVTRFRG